VALQGGPTVAAQWGLRGVYVCVCVLVLVLVCVSEWLVCASE